MVLSTPTKLRFARLLYILTWVIFGKKKRIIKRGGLNFEVDISEGIDLSLFWFGNFQSHVSENKFIDIPEDAVIFDVGANTGIMSLHFSRTAQQGKVYAFEPTKYALEKFKRNLSLNPDLAPQIEIENVFLSSEREKKDNITAYSSWKLDKSAGQNQHQVHGGTPMPTEGVPEITLDGFVQEKKIDRIDFIKIDTDGHEFDILLGAERSVMKFRPKIIFELGMYVMKERNIQFYDYLEYFNRLNYSLSNAVNNKSIDGSNFLSIIPRYGTIDVLAIPID